MTGLVLEGGTFRAIFSAGVMDAFLEKGIEFPYIVGVSAGISNAASYVSGQSGRNLEILEKYRNDRRYLGVSNFFECGSLFGTDFVFDQIPNVLIPFDYEKYHSYKGKFLVGVTDAETGKSRFYDGIKDTDKWTYLRATCAIPMVFREQYINGRPYYDGGLSSPICIRKALKDGCDKAVIILTQPKGFVKKCGKGNIAASMLIRKKYPIMSRELLLRHKLYNKQIKFCEELERQGKAIIIRPDRKLSSFEKDTRVIAANYRHGYIKGLEISEKVKNFIK